MLPGRDGFEVLAELRKQRRTPVLMLTARDAVSYTHLRAHETVLDLVCRLLLEKKKNQNRHTGTPHSYTDMHSSNTRPRDSHDNIDKDKNM